MPARDRNSRRGDKEVKDTEEVEDYWDRGKTYERCSDAFIRRSHNTRYRGVVRADPNVDPYTYDPAVDSLAFRRTAKKMKKRKKISGKKVSGKKVLFTIAVTGVVGIVGIAAITVFFPEWKEATMGFFLNGGDNSTEL